MTDVMDVIIFSQAAGNQQYGLGQDSKILEAALRELNISSKTKLTIKHKDPHTYVGKGALPSLSDVHIYLEVPCRIAFPWAKVNIVIPNQEWWYKNMWTWVFDEPSVYFFYRTKYAMNLFNKPGAFISWRCPTLPSSVSIIPVSKKVNRALYVVGGSVNKRAAAEKLIQYWKPNYPPLLVVMSKDISGNMVAKDNVTYMIGHIKELEKRELQNTSMYHVCASAAEGFGYTMAEAANFCAIPIWTDIPTYNELWSDVFGNLGKISTVVDVENSINGEMMDTAYTFTEVALDKCINNVLSTKLEPNFAMKIKLGSQKLNEQFRSELKAAWSKVIQLVKDAPPQTVPPKMIDKGAIPVVGIVTLVHNRPEWFAHAVRNIQICDYPREKMVWVIVDDSDGLGRVDMNVEKIKLAMPDLKIQYISSGKKLHIGEKRNRGCLAATLLNPETSVFAFMDDDDHYPKASVIMRVLWLLNSKKGAVYCSTLPMYDIVKYISAINVPPLNLSPCKRVSEASMCFLRRFWDERKFPNDISVAEGENFLKGREFDSMEIPPEGVIVSFLHGKNSTSRRVPEQKEANGCHYGFSDEYFTMISQIAQAP